MPFMIGKAPIRRTLNYLKAGKLILKDEIQIFSVNYNTFGKHHEGTRDFVFWNLPQIQYKNPNVQIITFKNMTPTPFIKCYYENGNTMLIDLDSKSKEDILFHLQNVIGKTKHILEEENEMKEKKDNSANFGVGCDRSCICLIPGQVPCPAVVPLPYHMRGKYKKSLKEP
ncbi:28S ribosomal protein S25, mitochondrial [Apis mellifera caucasica]|uniref:Small ribosomal subunit protein mS25 n=1 Tax=Apis mellifera TaxID=7460 RepID=A0A7M7GP01_APIME|nr:probable 28S ribosomal protein S25, mitochondrial [Apis mellifera]XP_006561682.1 probable 28S ribosomal protein S25, mitochondrial [Apis mellifera]KAG6801425.1 28S ribosomal protein S25, mitochondrial [Apis mellifera caucasica]KAG9431087.1 28S ribosomal protein S25, mitochondrial [Apis mellifera carnica]|eukprot:XP_006561681.1 probable 28S ribosomal protein S25, mitochondrial [Apis mellifera]